MRGISIHVDGATIGVQHTGAAAIARSPEGYFLGWLSQQLPRMTNNEAEYHAVLLGLALANQLGVENVEIVSDSEVVVRQMRGISRVNSARLKPLHQGTCRAVAQFASVTFKHVPRAQNRLADALAAEAVNGRSVQMRPHGHNKRSAASHPLASWLGSG